MILTKERIAELRKDACRIDGMEDDEIYAILDAYEAQRPRGAGEVPGDYDRVMFLVRGERVWRVGEYSHGDWWTNHDDEYPYKTDSITAWLPLPPLPKGGEE